MQYQPVVRIQHECLRDDFFQLAFDFKHSLARRDPGAVGYPENMCIDGDGGMAESGIQHDVGGFAPDAWQGFKRGAVIGYRSEEHTSELQSLMRISYAVFCLKK